MLTYVIGLNGATSMENLDQPSVTYFKPKANVMRRLNALKLLFTVACVRDHQPYCSVEWNLPVLEKIIEKSSIVNDEDKSYFEKEFADYELDYPMWSQEKHDKLERFTEKYFNLYQSVDSFLPFLDCKALTYALTDEMINDMHQTLGAAKREEIRARAAKRLCDQEWTKPNNSN